MQISTREEDFIVDTLALREELEVLNEVFTDPSIVKVSTLVFPNPLSLQTSQFLGLAWGRQRYCLASARFQFIHCQLV